MIKAYCPYCGKPLTEECECARIAAEEAEAARERYYDDPLVQYGWHQQDVIDMYRRER